MNPEITGIENSIVHNESNDAETESASSHDDVQHLASTHFDETLQHESEWHDHEQLHCCTHPTFDFKVGFLGESDDEIKEILGEFTFGIEVYLCICIQKPPLKEIQVSTLTQIGKHN